jgi:hypothetical protein
VLFGLGFVSFPMALHAAMILGYTGAISPHTAFLSIIRGGWVYLLAIVLLLLIAHFEIFPAIPMRKKPRA